MSAANYYADRAREKAEGFEFAKTLRQKQTIALVTPSPPSRSRHMDDDDDDQQYQEQEDMDLNHEELDKSDPPPLNSNHQQPKEREIWSPTKHRNGRPTTTKRDRTPPPRSMADASESRPLWKPSRHRAGQASNRSVVGTANPHFQQVNRMTNSSKRPAPPHNSPDEDISPSKRQRQSTERIGDQYRETYRENERSDAPTRTKRHPLLEPLAAVAKDRADPMGDSARPPSPTEDRYKEDDEAADREILAAEATLKHLRENQRRIKQAKLASRRPSPPPGQLSDEDRQHQQMLEMQMQAKRDQRAEHLRVTRRLSRSPSARGSPHDAEGYAQRPLPPIQSTASPNTMQPASSMPELQHQPSPRNSSRASSRAPSYPAVDRPGDPVARQLSSGVPAHHRSEETLLPQASNPQYRGGPPSDNWRAYGPESDGEDNFHGAAITPFTMNDTRPPLQPQMRSSSDGFGQQMRFEGSQGAPRAAHPQNGLHGMYIQHESHAQSPAPDIPQNQPFSAGYQGSRVEQYDDHRSMPHAHDMRIRQGQMPVPEHLRQPDHNRLHSPRSYANRDMSLRSEEMQTRSTSWMQESPRHPHDHRLAAKEQLEARLAPLQSQQELRRPVYAEDRTMGFNDQPASPFLQPQRRLPTARSGVEGLTAQPSGPQKSHKTQPKEKATKNISSGKSRTQAQINGPESQHNTSGSSRNTSQDIPSSERTQSNLPGESNFGGGGARDRSSDGFASGGSVRNEDTLRDVGGQRSRGGFRGRRPPDDIGDLRSGAGVKKPRKKRTSLHTDDSYDMTSSDFSDPEELQKFRESRPKPGGKPNAWRAAIQKRMLEQDSGLTMAMPRVVEQEQQTRRPGSGDDTASQLSANSVARKAAENVDMDAVAPPARVSEQVPVQDAAQTTQHDNVSPSPGVRAQTSSAPNASNVSPSRDLASLPRPDSMTLPANPRDMANAQPPKSTPAAKKPFSLKKALNKPKKLPSTIAGIMQMAESLENPIVAQPGVSSAATTDSPAAITQATQTPSQPPSRAPSFAQPNTSEKPLSLTEETERKREKAEKIREERRGHGEYVSTAAKAKALKEGRVLTDAEYKLKTKETVPESAVALEQPSATAAQGAGNDIVENSAPSGPREVEGQMSTPAEDAGDVDALFQAPAAQTEMAHEDVEGHPKESPENERYNFALARATAQEEIDAIQHAKTSAKSARTAERQKTAATVVAQKDAEDRAKEDGEGKRAEQAEVDVEEHRKGANANLEHPKTVDPGLIPPPLNKAGARKPSSALRRKAKGKSPQKVVESEVDEPEPETHDVEMADRELTREQTARASPAPTADRCESTSTAEAGPSSSKELTPFTPSNGQQRDSNNFMMIAQPQADKIDAIDQNVKKLLESAEAGGHHDKPNDLRAQESSLLPMITDIKRELAALRHENAQRYHSDAEPATSSGRRGRPPMSSYVEGAHVLTEKEKRARDVKNNKDFVAAEKAFLKRQNDRNTKPGAIPKSQDVLDREKEQQRAAWWEKRKKRDAEADERAEEKARAESMVAQPEPEVEKVKRKGSVGGIVGRLRESNAAAGIGMIDRTAQKPNALDSYTSGSEDDEDSESEEDGEFIARRTTGMKSVAKGRERGISMDEDMAAAGAGPGVGSQVYVVYAKTTTFGPVNNQNVAAAQPELIQPAEDGEQDELEAALAAEIAAQFEMEADVSNATAEAPSAGAMDSVGHSSAAEAQEDNGVDDLFDGLDFPPDLEENRPLPPPESAADTPIAEPSVRDEARPELEPPKRVIADFEQVTIGVYAQLKLANQAAAQHLLASSTWKSLDAEDSAANEAQLRAGLEQCNDSGAPFIANVSTSDHEVVVIVEAALVQDS